jgi:GT2 family glycosyltransferase
MINKPLVSVIIPTYNRTEKLLNCINSVVSSSYKNFEILVINDNPNLDLSDKLKQYKKLRLIQHQKELLWVASRNEGARVAKGELLFFLDDDNILYKDTIEKLAKKYLQIRNVGLLGPIMYNIDGSLWFYGAKANWISPYPTPVNKKYITQELIETDTIPNAYMISKQLFNEIKGEDEKLLHHEDTDLVQRLKMQGFKNYIYTKAKVIHDHGGILTHITPFRLYTIVRDHIVIEKRYAPKERYYLFLLIFLPIYTIYFFLYKIPFLIKGNKLDLFKAYIRGMKDGFKARI